MLSDGASAHEPADTVLVFAHPDDETVGLGGTLWRLYGVHFVCVTDGAPPDPADARKAGCNTRAQYARLRREELQAAVRCAGHAPEDVSFLGIGDQRASQHLVDIAHALDALVGAIEPRAIVTHPYEGGHPDHDATALAVHAAVALRRSRGEAVPDIIEMTSYHRRGDTMRFGEFLPGTGGGAITIALDAAAREQKQRLMACHASQGHVLAAVPLEYERLRPAPAYDFTRPPHAGRLFYEQFPWGMTRPRWHAHATAALDQLGLGAPQRSSEERATCHSRS